MAVLITAHCEVCGTKLKNEKSIAEGIGPECAANRASFYGAAGIAVEAVDELKASQERDVLRWLSSARSALRHGDKTYARRFFTRAQIAAGKISEEAAYGEFA